MHNSAAHVLVDTLYQTDYLHWYSIMPKQLPEGLSVYTVECFLVVYEINIQRRIPLERLFNNDS